MTKVTVLLTSYNHADYLKQSIDSILNQTFKDFELIIIDDCSTDNSWEIINEYNDKRIIKIRNKKNKGSILTKALVESFKGKYFAIAHCDDYWENNKLEKQYNYLEKHKDVAACFTYVKLVDENNNEISSDNYVDFNVKNRSRFEWLHHFFYYGNCFCHPSLMLRKSVQLDDNLFVNGLGALPDFYRWTKLCLKHEIYIYPEKLTCFRIRKAGMNTSGRSYNNIARNAFDNMQVLELYNNLSDEEFLKVFPQVKKYVKKDYFNKDFVLSRLCLENTNIKESRYFGLKKIYDLIQDNEIKEQLEKKYNYTVKDFIKETGEVDIFSKIDKENILEAKLVSRNNNTSTKKVVIHYNSKIEVLFNQFSDIGNEAIFSFSTPRYLKLNNLKVYVNNEMINFNSDATYRNKDSYYFYHNNPKLYIKSKDKIEKIYVEGFVSDIDISNLFVNKLSKLILRLYFKFKGKVE